MVAQAGPPVAGIDLGGTKILAAIVDAENRILGRAKIATPAREGGDAILAAIVGALDHALAESARRRDELAGIGIGSPGPLDTEQGVILFSANMNVRDFPLGPGLSQATGLPVQVQNDVRVGGYGEFRLGAGRGFRDILAAFVGTGIGGCLIMRGQIVTGLTGNAGEVGHMTVKANGPLCGCGRRGCMEALASKSAITRRVAKSIRKGMTTVLSGTVTSKTSKLKSRELKAAFEANDEVAVREVRRAAHYLGVGLGSLINVLGPEVVIVGGGVSEALGAPYIELVRQSIRAQVLFDPLQRFRIEPAALGDDAGVLGAALMARERFCHVVLG
jgi:glucokinase